MISCQHCLRDAIHPPVKQGSVAGSQHTFSKPSAPMDRSPSLAIQIVLQQQSKIARQDTEKPFIFSPRFQNSGNFQHFEFMSVESLINF